MQTDLGYSYADPSEYTLLVCRVRKHTQCPSYELTMFKSITPYREGPPSSTLMYISQKHNTYSIPIEITAQQQSHAGTHASTHKRTRTHDCCCCCCYCCRRRRSATMVARWLVARWLVARWLVARSLVARWLVARSLVARSLVARSLVWSLVRWSGRSFAGRSFAGRSFAGRCSLVAAGYGCG